MENEPQEYFFGGIITPGQSLDVALICRSLRITHFSLNECTASTQPCVVKATVESESMVVARLSKKNPQQRVSFEFKPQSVSVSFTVEGTSSVSVMGYVHDVDLNTLMAIRNQLGESAFQPASATLKSGSEEDSNDNEDNEDNEKEEEEEEVSTSPKQSSYKRVQYKETPLSDLSFEPFDVKNYKRLGDYIRYKDLKVGEGDVPIRGQKIRIDYVLSLPDGRQVNSSMKKEGVLPFKRSFPIAVGKICPGLDQTIMTMRCGGERNIVIRPERAFGAKGHPKAAIPGNTPICVHVKLRKC